MASALNTQINSYSLQLGVEFSEAYTITPTMTGSIPASFPQTWTLTGNAPTYEAGVGPSGGSGSWRFKSGPSFGDCRFRNATSSLMQSINDRDFSVGFWVKVNVAPPLNIGIPLQTWQSATTAGYLVSIFNDNGTLKFLYTAPTGDYMLADAINLDQWYYFATERSDVSTKLYLNGVQKQIFSFSGQSYNGSSLNFGQINQGWTADCNISNWYTAPTSVIGPTQIAAIYTAGSTPPRTVKYYDGTAWQTSTGQKVWNGSAWANWDAKRYDGTSWVTV